MLHIGSHGRGILVKKTKALGCLIPIIAVAFAVNHTAYAQADIFEHVVLGDHATHYEISNNNADMVEIRAEGRNSASGLYTEKIAQIMSDQSMFTWAWTVDDIQRSADISVKDKEDFAASIQIVFGETGFLKQSKVLSYAWVANDDDISAIVKSPRIPNHFRTIILGNAQTPMKAWHTQTRNILEDYKIAYGEYPDRDIHAIGMFTDNDQTSEKVSAGYRLYLKNE